MAARPPSGPATKADASALAVLVDIAGEGLPAYLWSTLKAPGQSMLEVGRERAAREEGGFSYRNAIVAEIDGEVAACLVGYRLDDPYELGDLDAMPELVRPLVELEAGAGLLVHQRARDLPRVSPPRRRRASCSTSPRKAAERRGADAQRHRRRRKRARAAPLCQRRLWSTCHASPCSCFQGAHMAEIGC